MKELSIDTIYTIIDDVSRDLPAVQKTIPYVALVQQVSFWDRVFGTAPDAPATQKSDQIVTNTQVQTTTIPQNSDYQQYLYWTL